MQNANYAKLTSMHFYAWQSGQNRNVLFKNKSCGDAIKFTLNNDKS
jgi:ribonucleoside-diphosphate reductase alpha chain